MNSLSSAAHRPRRSTLRIVIGVLASCLLSVVAGAQQIVVDDSHGSPSHTRTGTWSETSNVGAGYAGGKYHFTRSTNGYSTATWTPTFPAEGAYTIEAVFRAGGDRTGSAVYTIEHEGGTNVVFVDQSGDFGGDLIYADLGAYQFAAGNAGSVTISNDGGAGVYIADAIVFTPDPPPVVEAPVYSPLYPQDGVGITARARITDNQSVVSAVLHWSASPSGTSGDVPAVADGGDFFKADIPGAPDGETLSFYFSAVDSFGSESSGTPANLLVGYEAQSQVVINEILASNGETNADPDNQSDSDWVELYNFGPDAADLSTLSLSDDAEEPTKWQFPVGAVIPAEEYLLVWCDNGDFTGLAHHTNFVLSASGGTVVLYDTVGETVLDETDHPALTADVAWARIPDLTGPWISTIYPSPAAENLYGARGDAPLFSHASGRYDGPINVSISAPGSLSIRYTIDGSAPTPSSTLYTGPIAVTTNRGLRARAYYEAGVDPSLVTTASYFFDNIADRGIPVMTLYIDPNDLNGPSGIYSNPLQSGINWERPAHAMIMSPDGTQVYEMNGGLRIHGGSSRGAAKKSFRFYLRSKYEASRWSLPWLEKSDAGEFKHLVLRANSNDGILTPPAPLNEVTFFRDQVMRDWYGERHMHADGFFFALYLNGQYWGLYNASERIAAQFMEDAVGGVEWDVMKGTWNSTLKYHTEVTDGTADEWLAFLAWIDGAALNTPAGLDALKEKIDYEGFLDWMAMNIALQNEDWPQNNWIATKRRNDPTAKWSFHQNDGEWGLGLRPQGWQSNTLTWAMGSNFHLSPGHNNALAPLCKLFAGNHLDPNRTSVIYGILDNTQGRADFIRAVERILNFELNTPKAIADINHYADLTETEAQREITRWAANSQYNATTLRANRITALNNMRNFLTNRPAVMRGLLTSRWGVQTRTITFQKSGVGNGRLAIDGRVVELPWTGTFFDGSQFPIAGIADQGSAFVSFSGGITDSNPEIVYTATPGSALTVTLNFGEGADSYEANDVIFNEYWINDDGTFYDSINAAIEGDWIELLVVRNDVDLRGWRITTNDTYDTTGDGTVFFPQHSGLAELPAGTIVLIMTNVTDANTAAFPADDLDATDRRIVLYRGNGNLDVDTDPGFGVGTGDSHLALLAPGATSSIFDDIPIDFIAEGSVVTPASFMGTASPTIAFTNPFEGIGANDGAVFLNDSLGGFVNDNGVDANRTDFLPGAGGWVVDPPAQFTGDSVGSENFLTPGEPNHGQDVSPLLITAADAWMVY